MFDDPMRLFIALCTITASVYLISTWSKLSGLFKYLPAVVWLYFVPMIFSTAGLLPSESPLYGALAKYTLPFALLLLTISTDIKAILSVGKQAFIAFLSGTFGVAFGVITAQLLFSSFLPEDGWQGLTLLAAAWIGGSANMLAMQQSLDVNPSVLSPLLVADTIVAYSWLGIVIAFSSFQKPMDRWLKADETALVKVEQSLTLEANTRKHNTVPSLAILIGFGLFFTYVCREIGEALPSIGDPTIISATTWTIIVVVSVGLLVSLTPVGKLSRSYGASNFAYVGLFLLLTTVGAQANLRSIFDAPIFMAAAITTIIVHITTMLIVARLFRLPSFFVAAGSMSNIGGAVSGPIAAAAYRPALAPIGALLGVAGYIVGIYVPLATGAILAQIAY